MKGVMGFGTAHVKFWVGSFSNDDGDGNQDVYETFKNT